MDNIFITVVIPMYNSEKTIQNTLKSVLEQRYKNYEIIIVDDGSSDKSSFIVENYLKNKDIKWKLIKDNNHGVSHARNTGILKASGNYIAFLDSDDRWYPEKLEIQVNFIMSEQARIVGTYTDKSNGNGNGIGRYCLRDMLFKNYLYTSSVVIEKKLLLEKGLFHEGKNYSEDYELWLKIASDNPIYIIQQILVNYGDDSSITPRLSFELCKMEKGELENYRILLNNNSIRYDMYLFASAFSILKMFKRIMENWWRK